MELLELHIANDDLEAYALCRTDEYLSAAVEDHLQGCPVCRTAMAKLDEEIELMRLVLN